MLEVKIHPNESIDRGLKKLKKKMMREGIIKELRRRRYYEKPSEARYRKKKKAKFDAMLQARDNY